MGHAGQYGAFLERLLNLNDMGYILAENNKEINQEGISAVREENTSYISEEISRITYWEPTNFDMEATTIWSFPRRGDWATHNPKYRGNWTPYIPRNVILRYSEVGDCVLDQFLGSGTTLVEAKLLNRRGIGIDINYKAIEIAKCNLDFARDNCFEASIVQGAFCVRTQIYTFHQYCLNK